MDRDKILKLADLVADLLGESEPIDEELDYDEDWIDLYDELHNLKDCLQQLGYLED